MMIEIYPTDSPPVVSLIKKYLPEEDWPHVLRAIRQDPIVWDALSSADLRQRLGEIADPVEDSWAPGNIALLILDTQINVRSLRENPTTPVDQDLDERASVALNSVLAATSGPTHRPTELMLNQADKVERLAHAGLAALGLRENFIRTGNWEMITAIRPGEETPDWACTLSCLYRMIPEPYGYLAQLLAPGSDPRWIDLALHALLSNPMGLSPLTETSLSLLNRLNRTEVLLTLEKLHFLHPALARELAVRFTHHIPSDGTADRNHPYGSLQKLIGEAQLFHLSGQPEKAMPLLHQAWVSSTHLRGRLAEFLARTIVENGDRLEDHLPALIGPAAEGQSGDLASAILPAQVQALVADGRDSEAFGIIPEKTEDPHLLFLKASIASSREYKDIKNARMYAKRALEAARHNTVALPETEHREYLPQLAELLIKLNLPYEAATAAKEALKLHPNDAGLHASLSRAYAGSGQYQQAANAIELAVLYEPTSIQHRYQLAETLELAGDWAGALTERTTILERVEVPSALELRALANCALHTGEHQLAADVCQQALQIDSEDGLAYSLLGQAKFALGFTEIAMEQVRKATQLAPHHPTPWLTQAALYQKLGDQPKALETLRTATHAVPDSPEIHLELGKTYQQDHALTLAVTAFEQAARLSPESREVALHLGDTLTTLGRLQEAKGVLGKAYELAPYDPALAYAYARVMMGMADFRSALKALVVVIQSNPDDIAPYQAYARALLEVGEGFDEAAKALSHVLNADPGNLEAQALLADAQTRLGEFETAAQAYHQLLDSSLAAETDWHTRLSLGLASVSLAQGQGEAAIAVLQTALEREKNNPQVYCKLADAYRSINLRDHALETAREALRYAADELETLTWFAGLAVELDAQAEALAALERAVELAPVRTDLRVLLGHTRLKTGDTQGAWETFNGLFDLDNTSIPDIRSAAQGLLELEDAETAVQLLQRGLAESPIEDLDLLVDTAHAQRIAGDLAGALETTERAIAIQDDLPGLHIEKANLLIASNRNQAAAACLQHAINLAPDDQEILHRGVEIMRQTGKLEAALEISEKRLLAAPADLGVRHETADLARALLQPDYAHRILREGWPLKASDSGAQAHVSAIQPAGGENTGKLAYYNLYADLCLSAEDEIGTAEALTQALQIDPRHPRTLAIQANLNARKGDIRPARELLDEIVASLPLDLSDDRSPTLIDVDLATLLSIAETALMLDNWQIAVPLLQQTAALWPSEPLVNLSLARAVTLRAENQRLCEELLVIQHAPGEEALSDESEQVFQKAIKSARRGLGETNESAHIIFWKIRGEGVFHPDALTAQKLAAHPADPEVTAARIAILRAMGDGKSALDAARPYPHHPAVQANLALTLIREDPERAQAAAQVAVDRAPGNPLFQATLSFAAAASQDVIVALQAAQEALTIWPDEPRWHAQAAQLFIHPDVYTGEHNLSTAIAHLEHATRLEPAYTDHFIQFGKALRTAGEIQRATQAFERAWKTDPDSPEICKLLAESYLESGELGKAAEYAENAISLNPYEIDGLILRTLIALEDGQPQEALIRSRAALQIDPQDPEALYLEARSLGELNRPTEALGSIEKALAKAQNPLPLLLERVRLIRRVQGQEAALAALRELNTGYPDNPEIYALMSKALADTNQGEEAIFAAQQALRKGGETLSPAELSELHFLLGRLLRRSGQRDQAIHHLSEAIQRNPINLEPFLELGRTHIERREYTAALQVFQKGITIAPEDHRAYYQAGLALKEGKDYMKAEKMLRRAAELSPNDLSIHRLLGAVVALNIVHNREATVEA